MIETAPTIKLRYPCDFGISYSIVPFIWQISSYLSIILNVHTIGIADGNTVNVVGQWRRYSVTVESACPGRGCSLLEGAGSSLEFSTRSWPTVGGLGLLCGETPFSRPALFTSSGYGCSSEDLAKGIDALLSSKLDCCM